MGKLLLSFFLIIFNLIIFKIALQKTLNKQFFKDSFFIIPFAIYVWGDALILSIFWLLAGILLVFINWQNWLKLILIFFTVRAFFEVIFWLNAQAVDKQYKAPLFRKIKCLNTEQAAILYQLINFVAFVFGVWGLMIWK